MNAIVTCLSLDDVRQQIDRLDRELVRLIAARGAYVRQAAGFKRRAEEIPAPQRVAQVLARVDALAVEFGAERPVVAAVWRAMIDAFIAAERAAHAALHPPPQTSPSH